jgi:hypothetical protein
MDARWTRSGRPGDAMDLRYALDRLGRDPAFRAGPLATVIAP